MEKKLKGLVILRLKDNVQLYIMKFNVLILMHLLIIFDISLNIDVSVVFLSLMNYRLLILFFNR